MARILVIEDESDLRSLLRVLLEKEGHEVEEAADGSEGLSSLRGGNDYDLIITDGVVFAGDKINITSRVIERMQSDFKESDG